MINARGTPTAEREFADRLLRRLRNPQPVNVRRPDIYSPHLVIVDKWGRLVPFRPNRAQAEYRARRAARNLVLKSRQIGMTTGIQADFNIDAWTRTSSQAVLAHDSTTTQKIRRMAKRLWQHLPAHIRPARAADNATTTIYAATGSEVMIATAGSLAAGRGGTYQRVHGTEVAYWRDQDAIVAGLLQGVPDDGGIVEFESTANGAQGWFYEKCARALDGSPEWTFHFFPWWYADDYRLRTDHESSEMDLHDPALTEAEIALVQTYGLDLRQINWRRAKKRELGPLFDQEYPETPEIAFLLSGQSVFGDVTPFLLSAPAQAAPVPGHRYVAGSDWGQESDYSAISIIDATDNVEVYVDHFNRMNWDDMQARMVDACIAWNVETFQPERNSIGRVNVEYLRAKFTDRGYDINMRAIETTNDKKRKWVTNFYNALRNDGLRLLDINYATRELRAFQQSQLATGAYVYAAAPNEHDDTVIARLLAWDAAVRVVW